MKSVPLVLLGSCRRLFTVTILLSFSVTAFSQLLTAAYESQLEGWLGKGGLEFSNIFTKIPSTSLNDFHGSTVGDFHSAADGAGATFTLMRVTTDYGRTYQVVGGYAPSSWNMAEFFRMTPDEVDRTAFIFNLSTSTIQRQNLVGEGIVDSGAYQLYNLGGPSFGVHDLFLPTLDSGYAGNYSYGGTSDGVKIVPENNNDPSYFSFFSVNELEVYAVSPIPEPTTYAPVLGAFTFGFVMVRRLLTAKLSRS